jgi:penicillin-binding protein 1A
MRASDGHIRVPALLLALSLLTASCAQLQALDDLPRLERSDLEPQLTPQTSKIYAGDGSLLTTFHGAINRTVVPLDRVPDHLRRAVIAIEDERFYEHDGVDFKGIIRAAFANVREGQISQGGSTITQQLVKNQIIAPGREDAPNTIERKLQEAALARQAEKKFTKDEILDRYFNGVYFGNGAYGVQAAARTYFGKPIKELTLKEATTLAGVIKSPEFYDPFDRPKRARARRNVVLDKMSRLGVIGPEAHETASRKPLGLVKNPKEKRHSAPYFVDYVKRLLVHHPRFDFLGDGPGKRSRKLFRGGLKVYTTVDLDMQRAAEAAVRDVLYADDDPYGGFVAIDPRNGRVKAMVGGRDFFSKKGDFSKLNLAIAGEPGLGTNGSTDNVARAPGTGRQAGSAFKPFALAEALDQGVSLNRTFSAPPCETFKGQDAGRDWKVCNYESSSFGSISLSDATAKSVNVVFAKLILDIAPDAVVSMASNLGVNTELETVPSAALGTNPVNPLGMAEAFGTIATNGMHHEPVAITRIVDASGKVIYRDKSSSERRLDPGVAYLTTDTLRNVIEEGTGTAADIGRPAAGKTGTAQEYRDAWFVGYVPQLVASVWVGYPSASIEMKGWCVTPDTTVCRPTRIRVAGGTWPAMIWQQFMSAALQGIPAKDFKVPKHDLEKVLIDPRTGCEADTSTPSTYAVETYRIKGSGPSEKECAEREAALRAAIAAQEKEKKKDKKKGDGDNGGKGKNGDNGGKGKNGDD